MALACSFTLRRPTFRWPSSRGRRGPPTTPSPPEDGALVQPGFKRSLHITVPAPARHGWEEQRNYEYETSPDEKAWVWARALRHGDAWTAVLFAGNMATIEKREGALALVSQSLVPKGYAKESFVGKTPHPLDAARVKEITDFVQAGQKVLNLPGVAISLVEGGKVIFEGGFGVRELGKPAKVDADTLFIIASNTKALATLLLAKEIDDGKFTWDTPVITVFPGFKLGSAGDDVPGAHEAPRLRVHRDAARGPDMDLQVSARDAEE